MINIIIYFLKVIYISTTRFFNENYSLYVSALAFSTLLSIVPLLSISVFFLTIFPIFSNYIIIFDNYILKNMVPSSAATIQIYLQDFVQQAVHLPIFSILFLGVTVIMMVNTVDNTINNIWSIDKRKKRLLVWLFYSIILLFAPILFGVSVFLTSYLFATYLLTPLNSILLLISPLFINTIILSLLYIYVPNVFVKKFAGILGGFIAALFIEIAKALFALWISYFSNYELIYGVFAILPIFLIWLYIYWFIILWGAIFTYTIDLSSGPDPGQKVSNL
ncbi:MAG: YihY family inner membrane protein [Gammaproteobacteria bacterium]|nr:YihY family inner membrane protein [Gammaproteobacteria bacterium]